MSQHLLRTALVAAVLTLCAPARAAVDLDAKIPTGPEVKVGTLPNGLTYYIRRNGKPAGRLELRLVVKAGSVLEDEDQRGLAHFAEHMAFEGTTHFSKSGLVSTLQSIGVKMGADLNAFTSYDDTTYLLPVPTARMEDVDKAFDVLEDWAHGVTMSDADIEKQRPIVLEELRMRKGVGERVHKALMPKLFAGTRYAVRDPIGSEDVLRTFQPDALRRFYRDWYRPDLMAVVAVGDIDPAEVERRIQAHFGALANPAQERPRTYDALPARTDTEAAVILDPEMTTDFVSVNYPERYAPDPGTYGGYRDKMVEGMAGMMLNRRLAELAQGPGAPFIGGGAGVNRTIARYKAWTLSTTLGAGGSAPAIAALLQEQRRARANGFTAIELDTVRKALARSYEKLLEERDTTDSVSYVNEYTRNFLAGETLPGAVAEYRFATELLAGITLADVNAYARAGIPGESGKLVAYIGDTKAPPAGAALLAQVAEGERAPLVERAEKTLPTKLMDAPAQPGRIVAESRDEVLGITRLTLSNGVKVILKPTDFKQDQVVLRGERFGGMTLAADDDVADARYASALVGVMGIGDFTPLDLGRAFAGRNASLSLSLANYTDDVQGSSGSSPADIETMLQILWQRFAGVRRDEDLYRSYMDKQREMLRKRLATPEAQFGDVLVDTLYTRHPWEPHAVTLEQAQQVDLDRSLAIYRRRFASARGMTFVLVGRFDPAALKPLLASYLGTLPTPDLPLAYRDVGLRFAKGVIKKEVDAGSEPKSLVSITFSGPAAWSPQESLKLHALVEVMNLRIYDVLREKLGLVYSGWMSGGIQKIPDQAYSIGATLPTGPEKVDALVAALFAEIERLKQDGPDAAELEKIKRNWHEADRKQLRENGHWANELVSNDLYGVDPHRVLTWTQEADALTVDDVRQAARRYFDTTNYVQVVLNPQRAQ